MAKAKYSTLAIERAHHWIVKSIDALEEAKALIPSGRTRLGAYSRLYYSAHHAAVALLRLVNNGAKRHSSIRSAFGQQWVKNRSFPPRYGKSLKTLYAARERADYGEYVPTMLRDLEQHSRVVEAFIKRAQKEVPPISTAKILAMIVAANPSVRDFSFDIYCPKSYYHHTRITTWCPKGRVTDSWLKRLMNAQVRTLKSLGVKESNDYVLGLNSRVNQYKEQHVIMLDFDDISSLPFHRFKGEPGFFFRTHSGYHFIGSKLYGVTAWRSKMRKFSKIASKQHYALSLKRGYGTLRLTTSPRKPVGPAYVGRSR